MAGPSGFIFFIIHGIFDFVLLVLFIYMIVSWLLVFNVINTYNPTVSRIVHFLDAVTTPILAPFRAIIPPMGGLDISFLVAILVIQGIKIYLLGPAEMTLRQLIG